MKIDQITLYKVSLDLKEPFVTSNHTFQKRDPILVEICSQGLSGWGEAATLPFPFYTHEDSSTVYKILNETLCPLVIREQPQNILELVSLLDQIDGNSNAKSGIEAALWDLQAKQSGQPLYKLLGGVKSEIESGAVVSIQDDLSKTVDKVGEYYEQGYSRIKLKISPGKDIQIVSAVTQAYPKAKLMLDANCSYSIDDLELFKELDRFDLQMIEQPLAAGDLFNHATLQAAISTPICLDESVQDLAAAQSAIDLKSCKIFNLKPAKVAGLLACKKINVLAASAGIGSWCGGMLETGIGRAHCMAVATLPNFIYANDISESSRYFEEDIIDPPIKFSSPGKLKLPDEPGIGVEVLKEKIEKLAILRQKFS